MSKFVVLGGKSLAGEVQIQGSKNAAFPAMAACILTSENCEIENLPDILDVRNFLQILQFLGADFEFQGHKLTINTRELRNQELSQDLVGRLRGSILFAGAMLARFGRVKLAYPGGDAFGGRPIDVHLSGFRKLGARSFREDGIDISADQLRGGEIELAVTSVTGTENLILTGVLTEGVTEIHQAAREPHVQNLCQFLVKMGAKIEGIGSRDLKITGVNKLHGAKHLLNADEIDAVTFCVAAAATKGEVTISSTDLENLDAPLAVLKNMQVNFEIAGNQIRIKPPKALYQATEISTGVFPELLTDEQPLLGVLATQAIGKTSISDWFHEGRQGYLRALAAMGAKVEFLDKHHAKITGPTMLRGTEIKTPDLRAGASILTAALVAEGKSIIYNAEIIDRGYERIDQRLRSLGANIERID